MEITKMDEIMTSEKPKAVKKAPEKPVYDPSKDYKWEKDDTFELSGVEFGVVLNALRAIVNTDEARKILMAARASTVLEELLARGVESGVVKEKKEKGV